MASVFKFLTDDDESKLLDGAQARHYDGEEVIVREGESTRSLYILRSGSARVERSHGEFSVEISVLNQGELFGEMGFVEEFSASASVIAIGECKVAVVTEQLVQAATDGDPSFAGRFYQSIAYILSRRLRATSVEALSEFSWGTGSFARAPDDAPEEPEPSETWGGGSPLRDGS